jgi:hypothetical protein
MRLKKEMKVEISSEAKLTTKLTTFRRYSKLIRRDPILESRYLRRSGFPILLNINRVLSFRIELLSFQNIFLDNL